jgi:hypothetical protein
LTYTVVLSSLLKRESLISQKAFLLFAVFLVFSSSDLEYRLFWQQLLTLFEA